MYVYKNWMKTWTKAICWRSWRLGTADNLHSVWNVWSSTKSFSGCVLRVLISLVSVSENLFLSDSTSVLLVPCTVNWILSHRASLSEQQLNSVLLCSHIRCSPLKITLSLTARVGFVVESCVLYLEGSRFDSRLWHVMASFPYYCQALFFCRSFKLNREQSSQFAVNMLLQVILFCLLPTVCHCFCAMLWWR